MIIMNNRQIKEIIELYLHYEINPKEICQKYNISKSTFYKYLKENGYKTRSGYYSEINTGYERLNYRLKQKYSGIVKKCQQKHYEGNNYKDLEYLKLDEWVEFCNKNKKRLIKLWKRYINNEEDRRLTVSIDRIDSKKGYIPSNMRFVSYGYNSWRRNIRPVKIKFEDKWYYFMSAEEGSRYFDVRRQSIGDLLRGKYRKISEEYQVEESSIEKVLANSKVENEEDYYYKYIYER